MADLSGLITLGGTAQILAAFNPRRRYLSIQPEEDLWVSFGGTAVADAPSFQILAGETAEWGSDAKEMICRPISILGATTNSEYFASDGQS